MYDNYEWPAEIDGKTHTILCKVVKNRYEVFVDGDHIKTVYRSQLQNEREGVEAEIDILGKKGRFVMWEGYPDIAVDGVFTAAETKYDKAKEEHDYKWFKTYRNRLIVCASGIAIYLYLLMKGNDILAWIPLFILAVAVGGISLYKIRKYIK